MKMMIWGSLRHVLEHMAKPFVDQNADTGVFSQGDFLPDQALSVLVDLWGDRAS